MNTIYEFELSDGRVYDSNEDRILLLHPSLMIENMKKVSQEYANIITYYSKNKEERIIAKNLSNKFGVFDEKGNMIVDFLYDEIGNYNEEMASFTKNNKSGFLDKNGNIVVEAKYDFVYDFNEGFAKGFINNKSELINKDKIDINNYKANVRIKNEVNLFDLIKLNQKYIAQYKAVLNIIKNLSDKFFIVPLAYDLDKNILIPVISWGAKKMTRPKKIRNIKKSII